MGEKHVFGRLAGPPPLAFLCSCLGETFVWWYFVVTVVKWLRFFGRLKCPARPGRPARVMAPSFCSLKIQSNVDRWSSEVDAVLAAEFVCRVLAPPVYLYVDACLPPVWGSPKRPQQPFRGEGGHAAWCHGKKVVGVGVVGGGSWVVCGVWCVLCAVWCVVCDVECAMCGVG